MDGGRFSQATGQLTDKGRTQHQLVVPVILKALLSLFASHVASQPRLPLSSTCQTGGTDIAVVSALSTFRCLARFPSAKVWSFSPFIIVGKSEMWSSCPLMLFKVEVTQTKRAEVQFLKNLMFTVVKYQNSFLWE